MGRKRLRTDEERAALHREQALAIAKALASSVDTAPMHTPGTAGGDPVRLRGIPAIGPTVTGAIRGSDPERDTLRRLSRRDR